jgi:hypothetical protein
MLQRVRCFGIRCLAVSVLVVGIAAHNASASSNGIDTQYYVKLYKTLIEKESRGNCHAVNPASGALGLGQVMPTNVASWSQQCLGKRLTPKAFLASCTAQQRIIACKLKEYAQQAAGRGESPFEVCRSTVATWYKGHWRHKNVSTVQRDGYSPKSYTYTICQRVAEREQRHATTP